MGGYATIRLLIAGLLSAALIALGPHITANQHITLTKQVRITPRVTTHVPAQQVKQKLPVSVPKPQLATAAKTVNASKPGCETYRALLANYGWNADVMYGVMRAESQCNPNAVNTHNYDGVYDYGLLQLHGQDILDPSQNVAAAYQLWKVQGYGAWVTYNTGAYLAYL